MQRLDDIGIGHILRTDVDGSVVLITSGIDEYAFETTRSNKIVVVPEFSIVVAIIAVLFSVLLFMSRVRIWRLSGPV
jgi:hypothetical protein